MAEENKVEVDMDTEVYVLSSTIDYHRDGSPLGVVVQMRNTDFNPDQVITSKLVIEINLKLVERWGLTKHLYRLQLIPVK